MYISIWLRLRLELGKSKEWNSLARKPLSLKYLHSYTFLFFLVLDNFHSFTSYLDAKTTDILGLDSTQVTVMSHWVSLKLSLSS